MHPGHIGLRVRDLAASQRFYEALGFTESLHLEVPDKIAAGLLGLEQPIGFEAVYMTNGAFVLQLIGFSGHPAPDEGERSMVNAGLTHLSILVDDVPAAVATVTEAGGSVPADFEGGFACLVRDPDGQLIELLDQSMRPLAAQ